MVDPLWRGGEAPPPWAAAGLAGWIRLLLRAPLLALVVFGGLGLLLVCRLVERPLCGLHRPVTPWITVGVCRAALVILGIRYRVEGQPMTGRGALVANHASWLDIFALNAPAPLYFVAKSEVAGWPGIGWLARATGTLFIRRDRREAQAQTLLFEARLRAGHRLCFFPEGTSTDGLRVLPFKPTLFAAFFAHGLGEILQVQPVTLIWLAPAGQDPRFFGWWGDMGFASHLLQVLAHGGGGAVRVVFHAPVAVTDVSGRKDLARRLETEVRNGLRGARQGF